MESGGAYGWFVKRVLLVVLAGAVIFFALSRSSFVAAEFPRVFGVAQQVWQRAALPFQMARLSARAPDEVLLMPVEGVRVRDVADTWGAPRGANRTHEGQDIFAPRSTRIFSATEGYVLRVTDGTLGGNSVFILGAGGRRYYYTHLEGFAEGLEVGQHVSTDTLIGYVGNSGNAQTTPTHLHFGVYTGEGAMNPLPLLVDR